MADYDEKHTDVGGTGSIHELKDGPTTTEECATGEHGGLQRNLAARHLTMISLGGTIGTGLFLASGSTIAVAGPGYAQVAYCLIGTMVYCFMSSLGEMATYLPVTGSINAYGTRFFDPALGFMLGKFFSFFFFFLRSLFVPVGGGGC